TRVARPANREKLRPQIPGLAAFAAKQSARHLTAPRPRSAHRTATDRQQQEILKTLEFGSNSNRVELLGDPRAEDTRRWRHGCFPQSPRRRNRSCHREAANALRAAPRPPGGSVAGQPRNLESDRQDRANGKSLGALAALERDAEKRSLVQRHKADQRAKPVRQTVETQMATKPHPRN